MESEETQYYYRYDGINFNRKSRLYLSSYKVVGKTPKGVYIETENYEKRLVINDWRKKYAYPTKEEAMVAFIRRKERQIAILESQLHFAKVYLKIATSDNIEDEVVDSTITLTIGDFFNVGNN